MTEDRYGSISLTSEHFTSPEFRAAMRTSGVTFAEAVANLQAHARHFNPAEFDMPIAAFRPKLWKRMNRRPSGVRSVLQRLAGR